MQKKPPFINIVIAALLALLTVLIGLLSGIAPNELPPTVTPYLRFTWPLFGVATLAFIGLIIWQTVRQSASDDDKSIPRSERRQQLIEKQNRQRMLERVHAYWIKGVLEQSLHGAALIALGLKEQPDAIENPWRLVIKPPGQPAHPLPTGTRITQVYDDAGGELLILGEPGCGKTTLLLELARDLLDRARKDDALPMPVVFNLSSWAAKRQPLAEWLVEELNTKYQVPRKLAHSWVNDDQMLPLLDGLDEVASEYRTDCVGAINSYRREHMVPISVCSRSTEYINQAGRVLLRSAVTVQPLTAQQIDTYISSAKRQLAPLRIALRDDTALQELAATPLMLSVLTLAYHGKSVEEVIVAGSPEIQRRQVFATYVQRMLQRRSTKTRYASQQTLHWITWLARQLVQHRLTLFFLERMQPAWLPNTRSRFVYRVVAGLIGGLLFGLIVVPLGGPIGWLLVDLKEEIEPAEIIVWSSQSILIGLVVGLLFGLLLVLLTVLIGGLVFGLLFGLLAVLLTVLQVGLAVQRMDQHSIVTPNQGIWRSARNGLRIGLVGGLLGGLLGRLLVGPDLGPLVGLIGGLVFGLQLGGMAFIQHFALRLVLWRSGSMPWNYPRFLDYAAERILLRKVGGGYIFVHRLLLEYFASLDTATKSSGTAKLP